MINTKKKIAIIIGAGPAGLTAAYELLKKTDIKPIIFEKSSDIGGISKTINYKGNRIDIGGHRFFSRSQNVMDWWFNILPLQSKLPEQYGSDEIMLERLRTSRIFFQRKFFDYPLSLNLTLLKNLGGYKSFKIALSYLKSKIFPNKKELSLEEFYINRFGKKLYEIFFKDYTQKVWGVSCAEIKSDWGRQRVKGLSLRVVLYQAIKDIIQQNKKNNGTETSLIKKFYYPKFGPGQLWEKVAKEIIKMGGEIKLNSEIIGIATDKGRISSVSFLKTGEQESSTENGDYIISTMPIKDLVISFGKNAPIDVLKMAKNLMYRDFLTVGLLIKKRAEETIPDNWLYIQDPSVMMGRIQIFNNWSPYLVNDCQNTLWLGLEYFCSENDEFWKMKDEEISRFAISELLKINIIKDNEVLDSVVVRMPKAYPSYFGGYEHMKEIRKFTDGFENLFLIGRNGMHRYNNMDHSMLSAMTTVENIISGNKNKDNIWTINTEDEYHEKK